jgi:hypothetical protein
MPKLLKSALSAVGHVLWYVEFQASGAQAARSKG